MSHENDIKLNERQRQAQEAARSLPRPIASEDFRARLKDQFVAGTISETKQSGVDLAADAPRASRKILPFGWATLAAAAMIAALFFGFNRLPGPELLASGGLTTVTIDGSNYGVDKHEAIAAALHPGAEITVNEGASLDVLYPGSFVMRLSAGTEITLPERPGRWRGRSVESRLAIGEISVRTGPKLSGGELVVRTDEGQALIHGTLVSIFRNDDLTCICLFEGSADIRTDTADLGALPVGQRWVLFRDGRDPETSPIVKPHMDHMLGLDETLGGVFD